jgi:hypothetical protein
VLELVFPSWWLLVGRCVPVVDDQFQSRIRVRIDTYGNARTQTRLQGTLSQYVRISAGFQIEIYYQMQ